LVMPERLPGEAFDKLDSNVQGYIYDQGGKLLWKSRSAQDMRVSYQPRYDGIDHDFLRFEDAGQGFFVYDVEIDLLGGRSAALSIVTMQPTREYEVMYQRFMEQL